MKLWSIVLVLVFCGCGVTATSEKSTKPLVHSEDSPRREWKLSGEPSRTYVGKKIRYRRTQIEVVPLSPTSDSNLVASDSKDWFLVRLNGGDEDLNGVVFVAKWEDYLQGLAYIANVKGAPRNMLYLHKGKQDRWEYVPSGNSARLLVRDEDASEVGEDLLRTYFEQVDSGLQEKLSPSDRAGRERAQNAELSSTAVELQAACNIDTLAIDWSTVKEGLTSEYSIAFNCSSEIRTVLELCKSYPNVKERLESVAKVRCDFSRHSTPGDRELVIDGNELIYYLTPKQNWNYRSALGLLRKTYGESVQVLEGASRTLIYRYGNPMNTLYYEYDNRFYPIGQTNRKSHQSFRIASGVRYAAIDSDDWTLECGNREEVQLTRVVGERRDKILASAQFEKEEVWKREPYFLARDTHGVYYYVDRFKQKYGGQHYRVFIGRRGMMKLSKLKGLVEDSEGTVFSTDKGDLRLIVSPKNSAIWIRGKKRSELTPVDTDSNRKLIFDELGVYLGDELGHICDE